MTYDWCDREVEPSWLASLKVKERVAALGRGLVSRARDAWESLPPAEKVALHLIRPREQWSVTCAAGGTAVEDEHVFGRLFGWPLPLEPGPRTHSTLGKGAMATDYKATQRTNIGVTAYDDSMWLPTIFELERSASSNLRLYVAMDEEGIEQRDHSLVSQDPLPEKLLRPKLMFHPILAADEWMVNPMFADWEDFYDQLLDWEYDNAWCLHFPKTKCRGWQPSAPLNAAQLTACLHYTKHQRGRGVPTEEWLMVPNDKFLGMWEAFEHRGMEFSQGAEVEGWLLSHIDVRAAADCSLPLHKLQPAINTWADTAAPTHLPPRIEGEDLKVWRKQMKQVRRSVQGKDPLKQQQRLAGKLADKVRQLVTPTPKLPPQLERWLMSD